MVPRADSQFSVDRFSSVLNIGAILIVYAFVSSGGGSGLLAVLVFGLTLANVSNQAKESIAGPEQGVLIFHSDLSFLVRSFFFVLLGASVQVIGRFVCDLNRVNTCWPRNSKANLGFEHQLGTEG
jgi:NhaP-type Na+/H+ or K+/H+ antiporter